MFVNYPNRTHLSPELATGATSVDLVTVVIAEARLSVEGHLHYTEELFRTQVQETHSQFMAHPMGPRLALWNVINEMVGDAGSTLVVDFPVGCAFRGSYPSTTEADDRYFAPNGSRGSDWPCQSFWRLLLWRAAVVFAALLVERFRA